MTDDKAKWDTDPEWEYDGPQATITHFFELAPASAFPVVPRYRCADDYALDDPPARQRHAVERSTERLRKMLRVRNSWGVLKTESRSLALKRAWQDPAYRARQLAVGVANLPKRTPEELQAMTARSQSPESRAKRVASWRARMADPVKRAEALRKRAQTTLARYA